jgi:hypothetical protein
MAIAARYGTMVVVIQTKDGLLICADKRRVEKNPVRGDTFVDDVVKIFEIDPKAGFFSMGATSFCIAETGETTFDADQTAREFWPGRAPTNAPTLAEFQRYMIEAMKAYFRRVHRDFWPHTRMVDGEPVLFDMVLFFVDAGRIRTLDYQFLYRKEDGFVGSQLKDYSGFSGPFGGGKTCYRLCVDTEPVEEFEAYRAEAIIAQCRAVFGPRPPLIDTNVAREYAKRLIEIASQHEYGSALSTISPASDCALLSMANEFQWLCRA